MSVVDSVPAGQLAGQSWRSFLRMPELGRGVGVDESLPACVCQWRSARAHYLHSLGQDQSTVAERAECGRAVPGELRVSWVPTCLDSLVSPLPLRWTSTDRSLMARVTREEEAKTCSRVCVSSVWSAWCGGCKHSGFFQMLS